MPGDLREADRAQVRLGVAAEDPARGARWTEALRERGFALAVALPPGAAVEPESWEVLVLAGWSGGDLLARLGACRTPPVRLVLLERESLPLMERAFALGADDAFGDGLDPELLALRILRHLKARAALVQLAEGNERTHRLFLNIVKVMVKVLETKDEYTKFHSDNVARYARMIAARMGLPKEEVTNAGLAGMLHDFGKIGVAEKILNKSSRLTEQEFAVIKRHPSIGSLILESISGLEGVIPGIKYHHERYDGRGYPEGLKGEAIPLMGRIVGIADAFDTLTSDRTYQRRLSKEEAIEELKRCAGTQFDPGVVRAFVDALNGTPAIG